MKLLQYKCPKCGLEFDELVFSHEDKVNCPECGSEAERSYSGKMWSSTGKCGSGDCDGNCDGCSGCCSH